MFLKVKVSYILYIVFFLLSTKFYEHQTQQPMPLVMLV